MDKPITTQDKSQEEAERLLRLYGNTTKDQFNQMSDVEFTTWVSNNLSQIERLLLFTQRKTARPASTTEAETNLNAYMLAQTHILNTVYELAETGVVYKEKK